MVEAVATNASGWHRAGMEDEGSLLGWKERATADGPLELQPHQSAEGKGEVANVWEKSHRNRTTKASSSRFWSFKVHSWGL